MMQQVHIPEIGNEASDIPSYTAKYFPTSYIPISSFLKGIQSLQRNMCLLKFQYSCSIYVLINHIYFN